MFKRFINWLFRGKPNKGDSEITVSDMANIKELVLKKNTIKIGDRAVLRYDEELDVIIVDGDIGSDVGCVNTRLVVNGDIVGDLTVSSSSVSVNGNIGGFIANNR